MVTKLAIIVLLEVQTEGADRSLKRKGDIHWISAVSSCVELSV